jgi:hypothetical protein
MTTITVKGRRRKKVYVVNKDLKAAESSNSSIGSGVDPLRIQAKPKLKLKPKSSNSKAKTAVAPPKPQVTPPPKPTKPPSTPQLLKEKQLMRIMRLCDALPHLFSSESPKPLAIGITDEILADLPESLSKRAVRGAMKTYTKLPRYQQAIQRGEKRINARGEETEEPTSEHIEHANSLLKRWENTQKKWPKLVSDARSKFPNLFPEGL